MGLARVRHNTTCEAMCNPIGQAMLCNQAGTQLNLIIGLCIGHDILFAKYSEAMATTLIVKDRVLGNNPASAVYSKYIRNKMTTGDDRDNR
jgi:uncharacterized metal-binding protein